MKMKTFIYLLIQTLVLGLWPWSCKDYVYLWNGCNKDLCICVLHLKLWMLAMIQGLALQSQGSFSFTKEGSYSFASSLHVNFKGALAFIVLFKQRQTRYHSIIPYYEHCNVAYIYVSCYLLLLSWFLFIACYDY